jgi:nucleoside-diphosphate-sugar epimerase
MRDFLYVQDVADAFVALLESEVTGAVNIGSGQAIAIKEVVYKIADLIGRSDLVQLGAIPSAAKEAPLLVADVTRLSNEVGYVSQFDFETGLMETVNWWKKTLFPSVY